MNVISPIRPVCPIRPILLMGQTGLIGRMGLILCYADGPGAPSYGNYYRTQ